FLSVFFSAAFFSDAFLSGGFLVSALGSRLAGLCWSVLAVGFWSALSSVAAAAGGASNSTVASAHNHAVRFFLVKGKYPSPAESLSVQKPIALIGLTKH